MAVKNNHKCDCGCEKKFYVQEKVRRTYQVQVNQEVE